jgi:hypothetical protein
MVGTKSTQSARCSSMSARARSASKRRITTSLPPIRSDDQEVMNGPAW